MLVNLYKLLKRSEFSTESFQKFQPLTFNKGAFRLSIQESGGQRFLVEKAPIAEQDKQFEVYTNIPDEDIPTEWSEYINTDGIYDRVPREVVESFVHTLLQKYELDN